MKKAGFNAKKDNENLILILIAIIVIGFVFGLKPLYKLMDQLKNGTLFEKEKVTDINKPEEEPKEEKEEMLEPEGVSELLCTKSLFDDGGDKTIKVTLYHTNSRLRSIKEEIIYASSSEEYTNYILSEQQIYKQRKTANYKNPGYSVDVNLINTNNLKVTSIYLLAKTNLEELVLAEDDLLELYGAYDEDIYTVADEYIEKFYECE